ncbi:MAG: ATP-binding cassette domain-containing protein [Thermoleophilia bacterium]
MLSGQDIRKTYGAFVALGGVSLSVEGGDILGVAGPNGAGKTTLFDVLTGRVKPDSGTVTLDGVDVTRQGAYKRARRGLARTFQAPLVPTSLTVQETLEVARVAFAPRLVKSDEAALRELTNFSAPDSKLAGALDTLDRRKLLLCCVLLRQPKVLLLDEPCSGLLSDEISEIEEVIRRLVAETGMAVCVVEHRLEILEALAQRVLVLDAGEQIALGTPAEVFNDPLVRAAYFEAPAGASA